MGWSCSPGRWVLGMVGSSAGFPWALTSALTLQLTHRPPHHGLLNVTSGQCRSLLLCNKIIDKSFSVCALHRERSAKCPPHP